MIASPPPVAWLNGVLIPSRDLHLSVDDAGFRQGVIAVERLRTYEGRVAALESHVVRWRRTLEALSLNLAVDVDDIRERIDALIEANRDWVTQNHDCGIVMLATPGTPSAGPEAPEPTQIVHLLPLDLTKILHHRATGQPLFITDVEQPSGKCWPRDIKVRCRLHYYLADQQARDHHPGAVGLLIDHDGTITESSVANIAILRDQQVIAPPIDQVLPGITQDLVKQACDEVGLVWRTERLWPAEVREADEVWLMGTDGGLWFANRVDGRAIHGEQPGPCYVRTLTAFDRLIRSA
ncbi:MAG: aminotransferase class IV [Planctomycetaceae bacterium]